MSYQTVCGQRWVCVSGAPFATKQQLFRLVYTSCVKTLCSGDFAPVLVQLSFTEPYTRLPRNFCLALTRLSQFSAEIVVTAAGKIFNHRIGPLVLAEFCQ